MEDLKTRVLNHLDKGKFLTRHKFRISGVEVLRSQVDSKDLQATVPKDLLDELFKEHLANYADVLHSLIFEDHYEATKEPVGINLSEENLAEVSAAAVYVDCADASRLLYNTEEKRVMDVSYESFEAVYLKYLKREDQPPHHLCHIRWNPTLPHGLTFIPGDERVTLNPFIPPSWISKKASGVPEVFIKHLTHLIPSEEERAYVIQWLVGLVKLPKLDIILVLNGVPGNGKTSLAEIASALVGTRYSASAQAGFFSSSFDSLLKGKRLVYFDDIKINPNAHSKLKRYTNNAFAVEEKNKSVTQNQDSFVSFIIANNGPKDTYVELLDRRFYAPRLANVKLGTVGLTLEEWNTLDALKNSESEELAQLGHWLLNQDLTVNFKREPPWTSKFVELYISSLPQWVIECVLEFEGCGEREILIVNLQKKLSKTVGIKTITKALEELLDFEQEPIFKIINSSQGGKTRVGCKVATKYFKDIVLLLTNPRKYTGFKENISQSVDETKDLREDADDL